MGRSKLFTVEEEYQIAEEYFDTPATWTMTKIARRWKCSQPTVGKIIDKITKELNNGHNTRSIPKE